MASSGAPDFTLIEHDGFRSTEPPKIKRSGWHKRKANPSPEPLENATPAENPAKRAKNEPTVKFELPPPAKIKTEPDASLDDIGLNALVHTPRCSHCQTENSFQHNDESALVCGKCGTVQSSPELQRGYDTLSGIFADNEDKRLKQEVSFSLPGCDGFLLFPAENGPGCDAVAQEKLQQVSVGSDKHEGEQKTFKHKPGKRKKRPVFARERPVAPWLTGPVGIFVYIKDATTDEWQTWSCDFNDSRFSLPTVTAALDELTWHKGRAYFPKDLQRLITGYVETFDFDIFSRDPMCSEDWEWAARHRLVFQKATGSDGTNKQLLQKWIGYAPTRPLQLPSDRPAFRSVVFTDADHKAIWAAREFEEKKFTDGPLAAYLAALARHEAAIKEWEQKYYQPQHSHFVEKRIDRLKIAKAVDKIMSSPRLGLLDTSDAKPRGNLRIRERAIELAEAYLRQQTVIDRNREPLAAVCVCRAACENGIGLRHWDVAEFVPEVRAFNDKRRDLRSKLKLVGDDDKIALDKEPSAGDLLKGFVNVYVGRLQFKNKEQGVTAKERYKMHCLANWIGSARLNRIPSKGPNAPRKLPCLAVFLDWLALQDGTVPPIDKFNSGSPKDGCIFPASLATTVIYLVLSVRPGKKSPVSEKDLQAISGVNAGVLMACKRTLQDIIERAFAAMNH